jgi:hypothetical protein
VCDQFSRSLQQFQDACLDTQVDENVECIKDILMHVTRISRFRIRQRHNIKNIFNNIFPIINHTLFFKQNSTAKYLTVIG